MPNQPICCVQNCSNPVRKNNVCAYHLKFARIQIRDISNNRIAMIAQVKFPKKGDVVHYKGVIYPVRFDGVANPYIKINEVMV